MPEKRSVVMNTGPVLALIAALGDLALLDELYDRVVIPRCVADEILIGGSIGFGVDTFRRAGFLDVQETYCQTDIFLQKRLLQNLPFMRSGRSPTLQNQQNTAVFHLEGRPPCRPLEVLQEPQKSLDCGEAAVVQTACDLAIDRVCIDEAMGRRISRLYGLSVTGSLGILIKAIKAGKALDLELCIGKMRSQGIWINDKIAQQAREMIE